MVTVGTITMGVGMGMGHAAAIQLVTKYVPEAVGGAAGWIGGIGAFGGFVIPPFLGGFVDIFGIGGYATGFMVFVVLALMSITISYILLKKYG